MATGTLNQRGFVPLAVGATPIQLADFLPTTSRFHHALIGVSGGAIRWLAIAGGAEPAASYGAYVGAGGEINWTDPKIDYAGLIYNVKFIKAGVNDGSLEVALFW